MTHKTFRLPYTDSLQKCALTAADCCGSSKRLLWSDRLTASRKRDDARYSEARAASGAEKAVAPEASRWNRDLPSSSPTTVPPGRYTRDLRNAGGPYPSFFTRIELWISLDAPGESGSRATRRPQQTPSSPKRCEPKSSPGSPWILRGCVIYS